MSKRKAEGAVPDLDLTPIMNLVTILIPFLIMAAQFVHLAVIDSTLPAIGPPSTEPPPPDEKPPLQLSLSISGKGISVLGADMVLYPDGNKPAAVEGEEKPPTLPCKSGACTTVDDYDWAELAAKLNLIKDQYPDDQNVILVPDGNIRYEILVKAMDVTREDPNNKTETGPRELFPFVVIAGGAI